MIQIISPFKMPITLKLKLIVVLIFFNHLMAMSQQITLPYFESFETDSGGWVPKGSPSSWQYGTPSNTFIANAASGTKAWVTNLTGNYVNDEYSYLESPTFDFSDQAFDPIISFSIIFSTQDEWDYGWINYSKNGGASWNTLGNYWSGGTNWYNSDSMYSVWTGTSDGNVPGKWKKAEHTCTGLAGYSNVKFRFVFYSGSSNTKEGFGFDDIAIQPLTPYDVGVVSIDGPSSGRMYTSSELSSKQQITISVKNYGSEAQENIPVVIRLNNNKLFYGTIPGPVYPNEILQDTLFTNLDLSAKGNHVIDAWTELVFDTIPKNDSSLSYIIRHIANDTLILPFIEDFETASDKSYSNGYFGLEGIEECDYYQTGSYARLRTNTGFGKGGSKAITLDQSEFNFTNETNYLIMTLNLSNYVDKDLILTFSYMHHNDEDDIDDMVWIRGSDVDSYIAFYDLHNNIYTAGKYKFVKNIDITKILNDYGQQFSSSTQLLFGQTGENPALSATNFDGFTFDNISVYERQTNDVAVIDIVNPYNGCTMSDQEKITVKVHNFGSETQKNFSVYYKLNNGNTIKGTFTSKLAPGDTAEFTFKTSADASSPGSYIIDAWTVLTTDNIIENDSSLGYAFDHFDVSVSSFPATENIESFSTGIPGTLKNNWYNDDIDEHDWWVANGNSGLSGTGPSSDHTSGFGKYMYVYAGYPYNPGVSASLLSPCTDITNLSQPILRFWYHMYGADMGELHVDIKYDGNWENDLVVLTGNMGDQWIKHEIGLNSFRGVIQARFRAITGNGNLSEIAIDDIVVFDSDFQVVKGKTNASCGVVDGKASVTASGGIPGYTYKWSTSATSQAITSLAPGVYTVTVMDSDNREAIENFTILNESDDTLNFVSVTNLDCYYDNDGQITSEVLGVQSPYLYSWSNGETTININNLKRGNYTLTVTDTKGCVLVDTKTISSPDSIKLNKSFSVSDSVSATGTASVNPTGGIPPYSYLWSVGQITSTATKLSPGDYTIVVTDAYGCTATGVVTVYTVGLNTLEINELTVYPIPSTGKIYINFPAISGKYNLKIFNVIGKEIYSDNNVLSGLRELNLSDYPAGSYVIMLRTDSQVHIKKFILIK